MGRGTPSARPTSASIFGAAGGDRPTPTSAAPDPARNTCIDCGACMTGCRHNAKNTLVKNYLYLAERAGARVYDAPR